MSFANGLSSLLRSGTRFFFLILSRGIHLLVGQGPACRFQPTCSQYVADVFLKLGVRKGLVLSLKRLGRCHPWGNSGWDPVPEVKS